MKLVKTFKYMGWDYQILFVFFIITFLPGILFATKYAGEFQELGVGGRPCAMGGTGIAHYADPSVIYFNPAGMRYIPSGLLLMHAENFGGIVKNEFLSVVLPRAGMSWGMALQYVSVGGIKFTELADTTRPVGSDNRPVAYDTVDTKDVVVYISGARGNEIWALGANFKLFYRDLSVINGYGGGVDLGTAFKLDILRLGCGIRDFILSPMIWSNGTKETIFPKITCGAAVKFPFENINSSLTLGCDLVRQLDFHGFVVNTGIEFGYRQLIFGRAGLFKNNFTIGLGLKYRQFSLDYAFITHSELDNTNKLSAGFSF
jgi:hypothetical protein